MESPASQRESWTVARLLDWTRDYFARSRLDSPRLCAELLLAHALKCERIELYTRHDAVPDAETLAAFRQHVKSAAAGCPPAYLTGTKDFYSLPFFVTRDVLIPRPETEVLVERTIRLLRAADPGPRWLLDLGTGSGCIAVSLARHLPEARICASDVSPAALEVARRNAERHGVAERIEFREGDLFEPWDDGPEFDVIVSNPPYLAASRRSELPASVRDYEPHAALFAGDDGLDVFRRIVGEGPAHLAADGHLLVEMAFDQAAALRPLAAERNWREITTYKDDLGHERVLHARRPAGEPSQVA